MKFSRILALIEQLKVSLWFLPGMLTLGGAVLAAALMRLRIELSTDEDAVLWWLHSGSGRDAAALMSTLLASLITMTTLVVSITMVVLTMAANLQGPRLIRQVVGDLRTQVMLGFYVGTIVYLALVLRALDSEVPRQQVPHLAVTLGSSLAILCVVALLYYVHFLARSVVPDTMIERVGADLDEAVRRLLPPADAPTDPEPPVLGQTATLCLDRSGYVQVIEYQRLTEAARAADAVVALAVRPGDYLIRGGRHAQVSPPRVLTPELEREVAECFAVGRDRTPPQDLEFGIRQLVDIALRGLSPGINDPHTAMAVVDRLSVSLALIMSRGPQRTVLRDCAGTPRVVLPAVSFAHLVGSAFDEIRQFGRDRPDMLGHLLRVLVRLAAHVRSAEQRDALLGHARIFVDAGRRHFDEPCDLAALEELNRQAERALSGTAADVGRSRSQRQR